VHMENVLNAIHLHTSVTDLQVSYLPGDLTLNSDELRVTEAKGQVRVATHSKDINLNQIYGDTVVEDRDGRISIEPAGSFAIDARNTKGDVEVTLPPNASVSVDAHTRNGDIVSDFGNTNIPEGSENTVKVATFRIGSGGPKIVLSAENGDVRIKRGSSVQPPTPAAPSSPKAPETAATPHLKAPKAAPKAPVSQ